MRSRVRAVAVVLLLAVIGADALAGVCLMACQDADASPSEPPPACHQGTVDTNGDSLSPTPHVCDDCRDRLNSGVRFAVTNASPQRELPATCACSGFQSDCASTAGSLHCQSEAPPPRASLHTFSPLRL